MSPNERMAVDEENFSYEKFLWVLLSEAHHHKLPMEVIGYEMSRRTKINYPLYRLVIHPECQPTVCLVAGVHGNEIAGPLSTLHIITDIIHDLPKHYRYVIYPMINPSGFDLRTRFDADGRDLNAIYSVTLKSHNYCEVQEFYQDVLKFAPFEAVITLHEDSDRDQFYMYGLGKENQHFYHAICAFAKTWIPAWANSEIEGCCTDEHGLIMATARDHGYDGRLFIDGQTRVAITFETPGKLDFHFRVNMMAQLVLQSIYILNSQRAMTAPVSKSR
jgi:murein peptide amidase A